MKILQTKEKLFVHFETNRTSFYQVTADKTDLIWQEEFNENYIGSTEQTVSHITTTLEKITKLHFNLTIENTRLIATGLFQNLSIDDQIELQILVYVYCGLFFNIVPRDLELFYIQKSQQQFNRSNLIEGLMVQEFRRVVICGSFQEHLSEIGDIMKILQEKGVEVLSPWTTKVRPETLGTDFILLEGQELINKRDAWRHKYEHMNKFKKSDAIIVCNPAGNVGKGTMFEFGFITCIGKRIVFVNQPKDLSILFPYEVGLNIF